MTMPRKKLALWMGRKIANHVDRGSRPALAGRPAGRLGSKRSGPTRLL
ncbi:hypothetical protein [Streptomyces sp. NPDC088733]